MKERHLGQKKISGIFSLVILHRIYSAHFEFPKKVFSEPVYWVYCASVNVFAKLGISLHGGWDTHMKKLMFFAF